MCKYCDKHERIKQDSPMFDNHPIIEVLKTHKQLYVAYDKIVAGDCFVVNTYYNINFCPMCGEKL